MTALIATCRQCGCAFEPEHAAIVRGQWRTCPACQDRERAEPAPAEVRCEECGRPLRQTTRTRRLACLGGVPL